MIKKRSLFLLFFLPLISSARLYINIGAPKKITKSNLAISNFRFIEDLENPPQTDVLSLGKNMTERFYKNMEFLDYFQIVSPKAYIENLNQVLPAPYPKEILGFRWKSWEIIGVDFIFFGDYFLKGEDLSVRIYLYNVNLKKRLLKKIYKAKVSQSLKIVDRISNDIIKKISGYKSIFGTQITATRSTGKFKKELFVMNWNGKDEKRITYHNSIVLSPTWSNLGDKIAYSTFVHNKKINKKLNALFLYNFNTNKIKLLYDGKSALSSDFFRGDREILLSRGLGNGQMDVLKFNIQKKRFTSLIKGPKGVINVEARIHPQGDKIVFSSDREGKTLIYKATLKGTNVKRITSSGKHHSYPDWHPYKKEFVFSAWFEGRMDLFLISEDGKNLRRLTSLKKANGTWANSESPSFSPDGRFVVFSSNISGTYQLYLLNLETFSIERITFNRHNYRSPKWSPY